jgi:hypothetical protein
MPGARVAWKYGRRLYPLAIAAWRRWDQMPQHEKDRYRAMAGEYAKRGRTAATGAMQRGRDIQRRGRKR